MTVTKKKSKMRLLSLLLMVCMVVSLLPITAFAEDPGTVTGLTLNQSTGQITWDAYPNATSYDVWVTPESGSSTWVKFDVTGTIFDLKQGLVDKNFADGTYYPYVIACKNGAKIAYSGQKTTAGYAFTNTVPELAVPGNINWNGTNASWNAVPNASKYEYKIKPADNSGGYIFSGETTDGTTTSVTAKATSYIAGKAYILQVRAVGDGTSYRTGKFGSSAEVTPNTGSPTVTGLTLSQSTGQITWDAYPGATRYAVWVDPESGSGNPLSLNVIGTSFDLKQGLRDKNIADGTYYPYVLAYNGNTKIASTGQKTTAGYVWTKGAATTYTVTINKPSNVTKTASSGNEIQTVNAGDAITEIVYTANDGYYFYSSYGVSRKGIHITKISNTQIKVWGTPTEDVTVPVGGPTEKANQAAPTGVAGGELKITGTDATMEYAIDGSDSWTDCTAPETTVTSAGAYKVRFKETETQKAGEATTVTVTAPTVVTQYNVRINPTTNGTVTTDKAKAAEGDLVKLTVTSAPGYELDSLQVIYGMGAEVALNADYSFTMPSGEVVVNATFKEKATTTEITAANITVTVPKTGAAPSSATTADTAYTVASTSWDPADSPFKADTVYSVAINLEAAGTEKFTENTKFYINGKEATLVSPNPISGNVEEVRVAYTFTKTESSTVNPFTDVPEGAYYKDAVLWAVGKEITNGTTPTTFSPSEGCTRAQAVTFLWRAAGSPAPTSTENPFSDVKEGSYYYNAVLWAVEKGITKGTSDTAFSPNEGCTRAQIVTFLWRASGSPSVGSAANPFSDVPAGAYYEKAVLWAVANEITNGTTTTTFSPNNTCTRGQIVTFLYRSDGK